ncbi:MAG: hypothetical protein C0410_07250 [Anaerolinea sp.]|nr:hypothetical protein [Anaerolinea sp.]
MAFHTSFKPVTPSSWLLPVINLWHWLVRMPPHMSGPKRRRTRFLAIILITFILVATTTAIVGFFRHFILMEMLLLMVPAVFYIIAYGLNRSGHNQLSAGLTIVTVFLVVFASAISQHNSILLGFVLVALFLTSVFFYMPYSIIVYTITMTVILFAPRIFPGWIFSSYPQLTFLIGVTGFLTVITAAISKRDIDQIDKQSRLLEDENAERLQIEAELRESRDELEIRVAERTADLDGLNIELNIELAKKEKMELALKKSEELYRTLIEAAKESIFIINQTNCIEYVNSFGADWLGRTMEEIIGQPISLLFSKETGKQLNIRKVFESGEPVWVESETQLLNGKKWLNTGLFPLKDDDGTTYAVLGFSRDISERKQLEDELRIKEERFRSIYENAVEGIFQSTLDGSYMHVNNAMAQIFGYESPEEMIALVGKDIEHKVHQSPKSNTQFLNLLKKEGEIKGFEALNLRKDGSEIWTSTNARLVTDAHGEIWYTEGFLIDITKRKQIEYALSASDKRFRSLFENAPISLWEEDFTPIMTYFDELRRLGVTNFREYFESHPQAVADCAGKVRIIKVNNATLELFKARSDQELLESIDKVFCEESLPVFREELIALAEGKTRFDGEAINLTMAG